MHGNAIDLDVDRNVIVSFRSLEEITKINVVTGAVMWRMGGRANQFTSRFTCAAVFTAAWNARVCTGRADHSRQRRQSVRVARGKLCDRRGRSHCAPDSLLCFEPGRRHTDRRKCPESPQRPNSRIIRNGGRVEDMIWQAA